MTREILFRAKRSGTGEWVYGNLSHLEESTVIIEKNGVFNDGSASPFFAKWDFVDKNTVCQFTGLCDKDGKKIYEGDIVLCKGKHSYVVQWISDGFAMRSITYGGIASIMAFLPIEMQVIGNMFDNPELLAECETKNEG